jgi:hypothetical protein
MENYSVQFPDGQSILTHSRDPNLSSGTVVDGETELDNTRAKIRLASSTRYSDNILGPKESNHRFRQIGVSAVVRSSPMLGGGCTPSDLVIVDPDPINLKFKVSICRCYQCKNKTYY